MGGQTGSAPGRWRYRRSRVMWADRVRVVQRVCSEGGHALSRSLSLVAACAILGGGTLSRLARLRASEESFPCAGVYKNGVPKHGDIEGSEGGGFTPLSDRSGPAAQALPAMHVPGTGWSKSPRFPPRPARRARRNHPQDAASPTLA